MSGNSAKSETVRIYFINLREFLVENQQLIYQAMENKVNLDNYRGYDSIYFLLVDENKRYCIKIT